MVTTVVLCYIANRERRATSLQWRASHRIPIPYSSNARTQPRICLLSGGSSAPPIQPLPLPALSFSAPITSTAFIDYKFPAINLLLPRICLLSGGSSAPPIQPLQLPALSLSGPITSSTASINYKSPAINLLFRRPSYNYCCSGGHRTTTLLRQPSHNYCYSGGHRTTVASAAIEPASSSLSISDSHSKFATSSLNATVTTFRSCLGGRYSFLGRFELVKPPTDISQIPVGGQSKIASHKKL